MRTIKKICQAGVSVGVLLLSLVAPSAHAAAIDTSGIGLNVPQKSDPPPTISQTWVQTNNWPATAITNGQEIILTNVIIAVERDQAIGMTFTLGAQGTTTPSGSNVVAYGNVSYDGGRTWTTTRPISATVTGLGTNAPFRPAIFIPYTNTAGGQLVQFTSLSNPVPAGAANHVKLWLTNATLMTKKMNHAN